MYYLVILIMYCHSVCLCMIAGSGQSLLQPLVNPFQTAPGDNVQTGAPGTGMPSNGVQGHSVTVQPNSIGDPSGSQESSGISLVKFTFPHIHKFIN